MHMHIHSLVGVVSSLSLCRQEAVPLVDAFDIPDTVLNSALGCYDGNVYRYLYEWALKAPRNKSEVSNSTESSNSSKKFCQISELQYLTLFTFLPSGS